MKNGLLNYKGLNLMVTVLVFSLLLSGCNPTQPLPLESTAPDSQEIEFAPGSSKDLMAGVQSAGWTDAPVALNDAQMQAVNHFAAQLLIESSANPGNFMVSPTSVFLALAMTLNGADGQTREAMLEALSQQNLDADQINRLSRDWMQLLNQKSDQATVSISNAIWFDQDFVPEKPFLQVNADFYQAAARQLDFQDAASVDVINSWVAAATKGKIEKIVDQIGPDVVMYLINAIYFLADWQTPFDANSTRDQAFLAPSGEVSVPFMHRTGEMNYFAGLSAEGVALPYADKRFAFFALLPDGGQSPNAWLAAQDPDTLFAKLSVLVLTPPSALDLSLPKFESSYEDSLKNELTALGMGTAFDSDQADFSPMTANKEMQLFISEIRHKTFVRVDEKGTEAAAVTSVEMSTTSMPMIDHQLVFDRPFVYGILDLQNGTPLFVGVLENPAALGR